MDKQKIAKELLVVAKELISADTFKCPDCGSKVLEQTKYCVKCKKKVKKASEKIAKGDPWKERNQSAQLLRKLADKIEDVSVSEDSYHFDDPKYAKKIDASFEKISKTVDDCGRKVGAIIKEFYKS